MYQLDNSTLSAVWRAEDVGNLLPPPLGPGALTDAAAQKIVACAKKRMDQAQGRGQGVDYANLVVSHSGDLKGLCFVAADEFEQYFAAQGLAAKAVRVRPAKGGGDHYFTVINQGSKKMSLIVDATWRQFHSGGYALKYCLVGTLSMIEQALGGTNTSAPLLDMYKAGLKVLDKWKTYDCFS